MQLAQTNLSPEAVVKLRDLNIRDVEVLLSMIATPIGLAGIARVLGESPEAIRKLGEELRTLCPDLEVRPAVGPIHPMGHRPPVPNPSP